MAKLWQFIKSLFIDKKVALVDLPWEKKLIIMALQKGRQNK